MMRWRCGGDEVVVRRYRDDSDANLQASSVEALRKCKAVCTSWRQAARHTLCDVGWLRANGIGLHSLLKKGSPSPQLALALAQDRRLLHERDGEVR